LTEGAPRPAAPCAVSSGGLPPYVPDGDEERHSQEYANKLKSLLEEGRRGDAVDLFMTTVGIPLEAVA